MMLLVLLQIVIAPLGVVSATSADTGSQQSGGNNQSSIAVTSTSDTDNPTGQIVFANPEQQHLNPLSGTNTTTINLSTFVNANAGAQAAKLSSGVIKVAIPKSNFVLPKSADLTNASQYVDHVEINDADANNYEIIYHLRALNASQATTVNIPYTVFFKAPYTSGLQVNLVQTIYDAAGNQLDQATAPITVNNVTRKFTLGVRVDQDISSTLVSAGRLTTDYPFFAWLSDNGWIYNDLNPITVTVDVPTGLVFDQNSASTSDWTYNDQTKQATLVFKPNVDLSINNAKLHLPLLIPKGTATKINGSKRQFILNYNIKYSDGTSLNGSRDTNITVRQVPEWNEAAKLDSTFYRTSESTADAHDVHDDTLISSTLKFLSNERDSDPASKTVTVSVAKIDWNTDKFKGYALALAGIVTDEMKHNTVYGYRDGQEVMVAKNITNNATLIEADKTAGMTELYIKFDNPVLMTSPDTGLTAYHYFQPSELRKYLKDTTYNSNYYYFRGGVYYASSSRWNNQLGQISLTKEIPRIIAENGTITPTTMLKSGNTVNVEFPYLYEGIKDPIKLQNAEVYFLLPLGLTYHKTATDQASGLTDIQVIPNFKNTGKTAVMGKVANPLLQLPNDKKYDYQKFSLPIAATSALRTGKQIKIENYFVFKNNDGTYDLTAPNKEQSVYLRNPSNDPYQLATDSDLPNVVLAGSTSQLSYIAPDALTSIALVKNQNSLQFVPDLGDAGDIGDQLTYRFDLISNNLADSTQVGIMNVLPTKGENDSQFSVRLAGPATVTSATGISHDYSNDFDIYYSTDTPTSKKQDYQNANWQKTIPSNDYSKVRMIKAVLKPGAVFKAADEVNLDYQALIPDDSSIKDQSKIYNSFQMTFDNGEHFGNAIASVASVNYKTSAVNVTKIDADTQQLLAQVGFKLYDYDTDQQLNSETVYATNNDGKLSISNLKPGHYYLRETKVPTGYVTPTAATEKQQNQFLIKHNQPTPTQLTIANVPLKSLLIQKTAQNTGKPLAGAIFAVIDDQGKTVATKLTTDEQGQAYVYSLAPGTYTIKETAAPQGYYLASDQTVTLTADSQLVTAKVADDQIVGTVQLTNLGQQSQQPIVGSQFNLYQLQAGQATLLATGLTTNRQGQIQYQSLLLGHYQLQQQTVPSEYQLNPAKIDFDITATQPQVQLQLMNQQKLQPIQPVQPEQPEQSLPLKPLHPAQPTTVKPQPTDGQQSALPRSDEQRRQLAQGKLPQAGEQRDMRAQVIGLIILVIIGIPFIWRRLTED